MIKYVINLVRESNNYVNEMIDSFFIVLTISIGQSNICRCSSKDSKKRPCRRRAFQQLNTMM